MTRFKFKVWDGEKMLHYEDFSKLCYGGVFISLDGIAHRDECHDSPCPMDNATILQYTGLQDAAGKEVCEGDIINILYNGLGNKLVSFSNGAYSCYKYRIEKCRVIGNIYETPELLNA